MGLTKSTHPHSGHLPIADLLVDSCGTDREPRLEGSPYPEESDRGLRSSVSASGRSRAFLLWEKVPSEAVLSGRKVAVFRLRVCLGKAEASGNSPIVRAGALASLRCRTREVFEPLPPTVTRRSLGESRDATLRNGIELPLVLTDSGTSPYK